MNYRHAYHAGNFADVVKHALLALAIEQLKGKDKPFFVLDTHAGIGLYDLQGEQAGKTGEWEAGIGRVLARDDAPADLAPYLDVVRAMNPDGALRWYPGSPLLTRRLMRDGDRLVGCDLHPEDAALLAEAFGRDRRVHVEHGDGYAALKAQVPPPERRGLVLIDPPFERRDEFEQMAKALHQGLRRWAAGTWASWYPIKDPVEHGRFLAGLAETVTAKTWAVDFYIREPREPGRLNGCGMVFVNPPYRVLQAAETVLPWLAEVLAQGPGARVAAEWLVGE